MGNLGFFASVALVKSQLQGQTLKGYPSHLAPDALGVGIDCIVGQWSQFLTPTHVHPLPLASVIHVSFSYFFYTLSSVCNENLTLKMAWYTAPQQNGAKLSSPRHNITCFHGSNAIPAPTLSMFTGQAH